jgi:hypothetical protein
MRVKIRAALALAVLALGLALVGPATSAQATPAHAALAYPPTTCSTLSVSTTHPAVGAKITVTGANFVPNHSVKLILRTHTYFLVALTTDANGAFSVQVQLPAGVTGHHKIIAIGGSPNGNGCPPDPFQIIDIHGPGSPTATSSQPGGPTAFTGLDIGALLGAAALLIAAGVLFTRRGRNRSSRHA